MSNLQIVSIDILRSVAFDEISGSYVPLGGPLAHPIRLLCFNNQTNGDVFISDDGVNNKLFIPSNSFKLFDVTTNNAPVLSSIWCFGVNTQFYVKQSTAPSSGAVYLECLWGE